MKKSIFLFFAAILCAIGMNAATPEKLYLTPNSNWTQSNARFAAYFFGNGEKWVSMTKVAGETNLYEVTTPAGYPKVIFCRMNPSTTANNWNNKWNQTGDLTIPTDGKNHFTVLSGSWDNATTTWSIWPVPAEKTYKDITFTITASSAPQIHYWEGGDKMVGSDWQNLPTMSETAAGSGVYTYTVKDVDEFTGVKYLFKIGDLQTADQTTSVDVTANLKDFFPQVAVMGVNNWDGTDVMTVADDYLSASITLPLTAKKYDLKLTVDGEWKGHKDQNHITRDNNSSVFKDSDGNGSITADYAGDYVFTYTYANQTLTVTYPELPAVKTYKDIVITVVANVTPKIHYWDGGDKVVATDWENKPDMVATGAANTYSYTIKDVDEALGVKYIIVAGTAQTEDLHTTVDVTANFKDLLPAVEVMGINGWNAGDGIPMTIAEDYSASVTINFTEAKTQDFKLTVGGAWKGHSENNKITRANNSSAFTEDNGNASVKVDVAGDYVFTYTYSDKKLTVTYPASDEPIVPHYYIAGTENLTGFNWKEDGLEMTKEGDVYKHTFSELNAGIYEFKVTDGTWTNPWGYSDLGAAYEEVSEGVDGEGNPNGNIKFTTEEAKNITVTFNPTTGKITIDGLTEKVIPNVTVYFINSGNWAEVACYYWGGIEAATWPGVQMDLTDETYEAEGWKVYKVTFPGDNTKCIFTDNKAEGTTQTADLEVQDGKYYCYANGIWYDILADVDPLDTRVYLKGDMNEWCTIEGWCDMFRKETVDGTVAYRTVFLEEANTTYEFKIEDAGAWLSNTGTMIKDNCTGWTFEESVNDNAKITTEYAGDYTFVWDMTTKKLSVVYPELVPTVLDLVVTNMVFDGDNMTFSGSDNEYGIAFNLVVGGDLGDGVYSLDASSTVDFGGTPFTDVTGTIAPDMSMGMPTAATAVVYGFLGGSEYYQFNLDMSAGGGTPVEIWDGVATPNDGTGELTISANWDGDDVYVVVPGFNYTNYECPEVWFYVGGTTWKTASIAAYGPATITVEDGGVLVEGSVMSGVTGTSYELMVFGLLPVEETPDYTRTVTAGNFGTICLPFGGTVEGAELFECVGKETGKVYLASVTTLEAGVPYIFKATATELAVYSDGTTAATPGNHNGLHGTFTDDTEVAVGNYIVKDKAICEVVATCWVNANRAYLVMSEVPAGAPQQMPGRKYIGMDVNGENEATGVEDIFSTDAPVKVIENAQLIIIRGGEKFNAQGVRL